MAVEDDGHSTNTLSHNYPYASSPDIIRSNQKDAYFQGVLFEHLSTILRNIYGARFIHNHATEARTAADILYLSLTTLLGNRTLGEEYCDIVQVEGDGLSRLPRLSLRAGYIASSILLPYVLNRILPSVRRRLRGILEASLQRQLQQQQQRRQKTVAIGQRHSQPKPSRLMTVQQYLLTHLDTFTSPAPIYAVSLATFYFSGAYYHLSKRLLNLRYIFTRQLNENDQRAGYEVLGVLLVLQLAVQSYLHLHSTISSTSSQTTPTQTPSSGATAAVVSGNVEVSLDPNIYSANNALLFDAGSPASSGVSGAQTLALMTHTPAPAEPHVNLENKDQMRWLSSRQARQCTLCLEPMKEPSVTTCGHIFCWNCISDWCREKPECPLCRQSCAVQHILPLRG